MMMRKMDLCLRGQYPSTGWLPFQKDIGSEHSCSYMFVYFIKCSTENEILRSVFIWHPIPTGLGYVHVEFFKLVTVV